MNPNNFGIGNIVCLITGNDVRIPSYDQPFVVVGIGLFVSEVVHYKSNPATMEHLLKINNCDLSPLQLTEDWLIRFNASKVSKGFYSLELSLDRYLQFLIMPDGIYCQILQSPELSCEDAQVVTLRRLDYVHQLQNLFFDLEEKEIITTL